MKTKTLYYEDIKVGDEIPALEKPITSVGMVMYAAATWDFHRYHHDHEFTKKMGFDRPFVDGQELGAYLAQVVVGWAGLDATLKRLKYRFAEFVHAGDTLTCKGNVSDKSEVDGEKIVECDMWIENQEGVRVLDQGKAILAFPSRSS